MKYLKIIFTVAAACLFSGILSAATFSFNYTDRPGFGFNDDTPRAATGENSGTTLGQQRRNVLEHAASTWGNYIVSDVPIVIEANFERRGGADTEAVVASAGPRGFFRIPSESDIIYASALANSIRGFDHSSNNPDLGITINESIDSDPNVFGGVGFYYGFDSESGSQSDLLLTLLHEIGHGLGFLSTVNPANGQLMDGSPDSFTVLMRDEETGKNWKDMTAQERIASAINAPNLVFTGKATNQAMRRQLKPEFGRGVSLDLITDGNITSTMTAESTRFGLGLPPQGLSGVLVLVDDGTSPTSDACQAPFVNADAVRGRIALIDRGSCAFDEKVKRVQDAGAIAVVIANNAGDVLASLNGNDDEIIIPSIFIGQTDGNTLKNTLPGQQIVLRNTGTLAGTQNGQIQLHAPDPVNPSSSASHWSLDSLPDLIMEPNIPSSRLPNLDLTPLALRDIGWKVQNIDLPYLTYDLWASENITVAANKETDDADGDSATNFEEYVAGTNPMDGDHSPAAISFKKAADIQNGYELDYLRNKHAGDVVFSMMQTNNLTIPATEAINGIDYRLNTKTELDGSLEQIELDITSAADTAFFGINAEKLP